MLSLPRPTTAVHASDQPPESLESSRDAASQAAGRGTWRSAWRWTLRFLVVFFLVLNLLAMLMAFTTTILPPVRLNDPVTVYLVDHGTTSSLVLPTGDGRMIRYLYADWNYYVLDNRGFTDALSALLWPTSGALGRQELDGPPGVEAILRLVRVEIERIYTLQIERRSASALQARLDKLVEARRDTLVSDAARDMEFVRHPQAYTYFHNSNHVTARWLGELGCRVRGPAFSSRWKVVVP